MVPDMTAPTALHELHREAEALYRRFLIRNRASDGSMALAVASSNARAEGLAEAVALLEGLDVVEVRATVAAELDREAADGLAGAARCRAALAAGTRFDVI